MALLEREEDKSGSHANLHLLFDVFASLLLLLLSAAPPRLFQVSPQYIRLCELRNEDRASNPIQFGSE